MWSLFQIVQAAIPYMASVAYTYENHHIRCTWFIFDVSPSLPISHLLHALLVIIPILIPIFPVTISCIISIRAMFFAVKSPSAPSSQNGPLPSKNRGKHKRRATVTILILTIVYVIFNLPPSLTAIIMLVDETLLHWDTYFYFMNFQEVHCVALNACLNPLIYLLTMHQMRSYLRESVDKARNHFSRSVMNPGDNFGGSGASNARGSRAMGMKNARQNNNNDARHETV